MSVRHNCNKLVMPARKIAVSGTNHVGVVASRARHAINNVISCAVRGSSSSARRERNSRRRKLVEPLLKPVNIRLVRKAKVVAAAAAGAEAAIVSKGVTNRLWLRNRRNRHRQ